ncbi:hypothetical protein KCU93_g8950, partial [Aureobasidium melanogenum]|jgi:hypothetical protein
MNTRTTILLGVAIAIVTFTLLFNEFGYQSRTPNHAQDSDRTDIKPATSATDMLDRTRVATIVETRARPNLVPLIVHFANVLGPTWPVHVVGSEENQHLFSESAVFQRYVSSGQITLEQLDPSMKLKTGHDVSAFLAANGDFWHSLAPADHVLLFQADSILCSNSPRRVDDFLEYDFVGAPISSKYGVGYNGGLSLRNRTRTLEIIESVKWDGSFEDQWFYKQLMAVGANLPTEEVASQFAVETIYAEFPLGLHQVQRWHKGDELKNLTQWCPEVQIADGSTSLWGKGN